MANKFETEIAESFRAKSLEQLPSALKVCPFVYHKLVVNSTFSSYKVDSPCDALVDGYQLPSLALELKECKVRGSFPFERVPQNQEDGLLAYDAVGRRAFLLICFRTNPLKVKDKIGKTATQIRLLEERRAWALSIHDYLTLQQRAIQAGASSLSAETIETYARPIEPVRSLDGSLIWNIEPLFF